MADDNILSRMSGLHVGAALMTLQTANAKNKIVEVLLDVTDIGIVRLTAVRKESRKGKGFYSLWTAVKAALVAKEAIVALR